MRDEALHGGVRLHGKGTTVESDHSRVLPRHLPHGQPGDGTDNASARDGASEHTGCQQGVARASALAPRLAEHLGCARGRKRDHRVEAEPNARPSVATWSVGSRSLFLS